MRRISQPILGLARILLAATFALALFGCSGARSAAYRNTRLRSVDLNNLVQPEARDGALALAAAKNEWASFQLQVSGLPAPDDRVAYTFRIQPLNLQTAKGSIGVQHASVYQILSMPVDVNRAGYVRHTGLSMVESRLPRALLPMPMTDGRMNLSAARDPDKPTDPNARMGSAPVMLWVDLHIPPEVPAGQYAGVCEVLATGLSKPIASIPINLKVYDFVLPDDRHLNLVGQIDWDSLERLYPDRFEAVTPRFLNRNDRRYASAVKTLDQLVALAQANRVEVVVPKLQPTVKWPAGRPPQVTWGDFDSVVAPWLKGDMFPDKVPLGYWPMPPCEGLSEFDPKSQRDYWADAATHFDQLDWLSRCPIFIEKSTSGRDDLERVKLSADAASALSAHSRVRVAVPLEDDQVQLSDARNQNLISPQDTYRLITANPGIVFASPLKPWPAGVIRPFRWMRTDLTGLLPYVGAGGDERDVRLWAWLSFLPLPQPPLGVQYGPVQFIRWGSALPRTNSPSQPGDPNDLIWFYPGSWFGVDQPVPTIQLKWLRRAQQDFEYLHLARLRGDVINALLVSRLMTKPVELQPAQQPDPVYGLMSGTTDPKAWDQAIELLAKRILLREPGQQPDQIKDNNLNLEILRWGQSIEQPVLLGRTAQWSWDSSGVVSLRVGVDVYNASDSTPSDNTLGWTDLPPNSGWQVRPQPITIPALATYHVARFPLNASVDSARIHRRESRPIEVTFTNGFDPQRVSKVQMVLPVGICDRREGMLDLNGSLNDWSTEDAIQDGPMIKLLTRPAVQKRVIERAASPTQIFTGWGEENFYLAFKIHGVSSAQAKSARNFVSYQFRRAWGEDLCQLLVQAVYADNTRGPLMHVVCKPNAGQWVERKLDERIYADPWQAFEGSGMRYAATIDGADWRGEIAIPWKALNAPDKKMPVMLRFNFTQHLNDTAESSSWAGPVDFGRDDDFTGVLVLRDPERPGNARVDEN